MPSAGPTPQRTEPARAAATTTTAAVGGLEADWRRYIPDTALLVSGSFGGPFVIFTLTPLRNGLTLAAQDRVSTMSSLYRRCFMHGFKSGWVGGLWPSVPAIPQFCVLGPMYHLYTSFLGQQGALVCTAVTETAITYGANTRNAEVAYNQYVPRKDRLTNLTPAYKPIGPGALMHAVRNALGMCGMRVFAAPLDEHMCKVIRNPQASRMVSDFVASCLSGRLLLPYARAVVVLTSTTNTTTRIDTRNAAFSRVDENPIG
ncbi:hypothetical protein FOZ60_000422 [Perkinsus olseni]|uniref:Uncharacterized protein n=1 Tax=Perkinsus olseni TaxID=32597 RepID=A0A7J6P2F4_PEROL|nr:hypothetical protein FOZ60_000422 [Perkinsus olseni]